MGRLVDGRWTENDANLFRNGRFERQSSRLNQKIPLEIVEAMTAEPRRFHLIASQSCPWSHRAMIMRRIKNLELSVPLQIASGDRTEGYPVNGNRVWRLPGTVREVTYMHEIYSIFDEAYTGRASVPVLWDSQTKRIVSNDSLQMMKAFDQAGPLAPSGGITLYPQDLQSEIDELNSKVFSGLANAVYRAGLARSQQHYDDAIEDVFETLDQLETRLSRGRLMFGRRLTLTDVVLFPVLVRFDIVYHTHFRCTRRRLVDYPQLWAYSRDLFSLEPFSIDVDFAAIQRGYFINDGDHNPHGIISARPDADWHTPHPRAAFGTLLVSLHAGGDAEFTHHQPDQDSNSGNVSS